MMKIYPIIKKVKHEYQVSEIEVHINMETLMLSDSLPSGEIIPGSVADRKCNMIAYEKIRSTFMTNAGYLIFEWYRPKGADEKELRNKFLPWLASYGVRMRQG